MNTKWNAKIRDGVRMGKRDKFDELDKRLRAEYDRKIQEIEDDLSDDGSFDSDRINSEMLYQRIQERIREREEEKEKIQREKKKRWYRVERVAVVSVVTVVGIFLASMTSEANRTYLGDRIRYLMGDEVAVCVRSNEEQKNEESEESAVYREIEEQIGISVPHFRYRPSTENTFEYKIMHESSMAMMEYQYDDILLTLWMVNKNRAETSGMVLHGKKIKEVDVMEGLFTIPVQEIKDTTDIKFTYAAQWEYKEGYYQLSGKVVEKEFLKIVESIYY